MDELRAREEDVGVGGVVKALGESLQIAAQRDTAA